MKGGQPNPKWWRRVMLSIQVVAVYIAGLVVLAGSEMLTVPLVLVVGLIWRR